MVFLRLLILGILVLVLPGYSSAQCKSSIETNVAVEENEIVNQSDIGKLIGELRKLKLEYENCRIVKDSVYAKILHKIAIYECMRNGDHASAENISYTEEAIRINLSGLRGSYPAYATKSFHNMAKFKADAGDMADAVLYHDSASFYAAKYPDFRQFLKAERLPKSNALFKLGDYQACIEETLPGLRDATADNDSLMMICFYTQRAEAFQFQDNFQSAKIDADVAIRLADLKLLSSGGDDYTISLLNDQLAVAYKIKATTITDPAFINQFETFVQKSLYYRKQTANNNALAGDYIDFGAHYFNKFKQFQKARLSYLQAIKFGGKDKYNLAFGYLNLGAADYPLGNYASAEKHYLQMLAMIGIPAKSILDNQPVKQLMLVPHKTLVQTFLNNKTELLLGMYAKKKQRKYLEASLSNALVNDSVIKETRLEQSAERSKLYWRKKTHSFFTNALEACYLAADYSKAFYFMEKSRAVILADKLNEIGANALLPRNEIAKERALLSSIAGFEKSMRELTAGSLPYNEISIKLLEARQQLSNHIRQVEKNYPAYYKYKFADGILSLPDFQKYLASNKQSFVHYFLGDTVSYVLSVSPQKVQMIRVSSSKYNSKNIDTLTNYFSDKGFQNSRYLSFVKASNQFYMEMLEPIKPQAGSVIICADGFTLPFDALCTDASGRHFLLEQYAFSYVYSAGSLLYKKPLVKAAGDFVGFAPVTFRPYLQLADLAPSAASLNEAASNYRGVSVFVNEQSSRKNFLANLGAYSVVNIFSHATAGVDDDEPVLFMQDSIIHLSELQYLQSPAARLVVLSACQTSSGKNQTGEGIYSLSRGFAAAGIPTVMATIWKADERAVYNISIRFHEYIAKGMRQDEALRLAKLDYLALSNKEQSLPYYWSNIVLMGNTEAIVFEKRSSSLQWILGIGALLLGIFVAFRLSKQRRASRRNI